MLRYRGERAQSHRHVNPAQFTYRCTGALLFTGGSCVQAEVGVAAMRPSDAGTPLQGSSSDGGGGDGEQLSITRSREALSFNM